MSGSKELLGFFIAVNALAAYLNHLDDTDEVHGYYEPLHFLLFGRGLQTWEYSPAFSLRSYAFLAPLYLVGLCLKTLRVVSSEPELFTSLRMALGLFFAYCETRFVLAVQASFGGRLLIICTVLLAVTPGVLYCSTSFLPSAVCASFMMLAVSSWLERRGLLTVLWGSFAALFTGWPFCGALFLPFGLDLLMAQPTLVDKIRFCLQGPPLPHRLSLTCPRRLGCLGSPPALSLRRLGPLRQTHLPSAEHSPLQLPRWRRRALRH